MIPLPKALGMIFLSAIFVCGLSFLAFFYYRHIESKNGTDPSFNIVAIVQTSPHVEGVKTAFLAELLDLSVDRPKNLYSFSAKEAKKKILKAPCLRDASIRKIRPGTVHIDYVLRKPIAYIGDYSNTAMDEEGVLFPVQPFYSPKKLPTLFLGQDCFSTDRIWGAKVSGQRVDLAMALLGMIPKFCDEATTLVHADVSRAFASSDGQRQVVVILEDRVVGMVEGKPALWVIPRVLRLRPDNFEEQLANYVVLRDVLRQKDLAAVEAGNSVVRKGKATVIDLRLSDLAFFSAEP